MWELFCMEHGIKPGIADGNFADSDAYGFPALHQVHRPHFDPNTFGLWTGLVTRIVPAGTGLIWKSLKDIAAVGTLFPVLIAFDLRQSGKDGHPGTTGYFATAFGAFAATLIVAQAVGADRFDIPLSVYATPTVLFAVGLRARCLGDVGTLLSFNAGSFGKLSHRH